MFVEGSQGPKKGHKVTYEKKLVLQERHMLNLQFIFQWQNKNGHRKR